MDGIIPVLEFYPSAGFRAARESNVSDVLDPYNLRQASAENDERRGLTYKTVERAVAYP
jgi:hypothetical protein